MLSTELSHRAAPAAGFPWRGLVVRAEADGRLGIHDPACGRCSTCTAGVRAACLHPAGDPAPGAEGPAGDDASRTWRWRPGAAAYADRADELLGAAVADDLLRRSVPARPAVLVIGDGPVGRAAAVAALGAGAAVVVLLATPGPLADAAMRLSAPGVLGPVPAEGAREHLATLSPSGRADVVLAADGDLEAAARQVRRGGAIAAVVPPTGHPSVTTVVQRELALPSPRDLVQAALSCRLAGPGIRTTEGADHGH
jgi:hypothetical protein